MSTKETFQDIPTAYLSDRLSLAICNGKELFALDDVDEAYDDGAFVLPASNLAAGRGVSFSSSDRREMILLSG